MIASLLAALALAAQLGVEYEVQKIPAPAGSNGLGEALALDGDVAVSGVINHTLGPWQNAVVIFRWDGAAWVDEQFVTTDDLSIITAVSVSGDVVACGAPLADVGGKDEQGAVRVLRRVDGTWIEQATLVATDGQPLDHFGSAVDVSGDVVVVGAPLDDFHPTNPGTNEGTVHVFRWTGSAWVKEQKLFIAEAPFWFRFGEHVAVDGDVLVVGVPSDFSGNGGGSAYVFRWNGLKWIQEQKLTLSDGTPYDLFGTAVDVHDDVIVVAASQDDPQAADPNGAGSISVFRWNGTTWLLEAKLSASDGAFQDFLGRTVGVGTDLVVAGAVAHDVHGLPDAGAAYAWRRNGSTWTEDARLHSSAPATDDGYGRVAASGDAVLVSGETGALLAFDLLPPAWTWKGHALAGSAGLPVLTATGEPAAGQPITLRLVDAAPAASTVLIAGLSVLDASFKGGILVPAPDAVIVGLATDADGHLSLGTSWPAGVPAGQLIALQAWVSDALGPAGYAASNGITALAQ